MLSYRNFRTSVLLPTCKIIANSLEGEDAIFTARIKRYESIIRKIIRERTDISRIEDIVGLRIIVDSLSTLARIKTRLCSMQEHTRTRDYMSEDRPDGYKAVHIILSFPHPESQKDIPVEIQLRTYYQHLWASLSESFGQRVKEGDGPENLRLLLREVSNKLSHIDQSDQPKRALSAIKTNNELTFYILNFSCESRTVINFIDLDQMIHQAIEYLLSFENSHRQIAKFETVLMCSHAQDTIYKTHIRYYPRSLIEELVDAADIQLPAWALENILRQRIS